MRIVYFGDKNPGLTSAQRAEALRRLGHTVLQLAPQDAIPRNRLLASFNFRTGFRLFGGRVRRKMCNAMGRESFDLAWIDAGAELDAAFYQAIKKRVRAVVNYNCDDPFGGRDRNKWDLFKTGVPYHDLTVVMRLFNMQEARAAGAHKVARVFMSYDPVAHAPRVLSDIETNKWASEVIFIGSWMPERGPFMVSLLDAGVPLTIQGDHWQKAPEYERLRSVIRGAAVYGGEYVKAIQYAKVAIGLLSKGNRDLHTTRSAEVPFIGGAVFCAERTTEHEAMFRDGVEAALWSTPGECAKQCLHLLREATARKAMAEAAHARVIKMGISNDETVAWILDALRSPSTELVRPLPQF